MKNKLLISLLFFVLGCDISQPENSKYDPFICLIHPENKIYMPEEEIIIGFNFEINPDTIHGISVVEQESETELPVEITGKNIIIPPPLPAESKVLISIDQALKSVDNKPLKIGAIFSEKDEILTFEIETGAKLAEVVEIIPKDTKSATVGVQFDSAVKIDFQEIDPKPADLMQFENWIVFSYNSPVTSITLSDVKSIKRDEEIELSITLPKEEPKSGKLEYSYTVSDNSVTVSLEDDSAIAAKLENLSVICPGNCTVSLGDLKPETEYVLTLSVFSTTEVKKELISFKTEPIKPHIMISEIMHSPLKEPEKSWEFVEVYNNGTMDFDLANCFIDDKNDSKGKDPLEPVNADGNTILKPGDTALVTGNEASFGDINTLWLLVDDTTIADGGLTGSETVQIICEKEGVETIEAMADPSSVDSDKGYSVNFDAAGLGCSSENEGGTPGEYCDCL